MILSALPGARNKCAGYKALSPTPPPHNPIVLNLFV